MKQFFIDKNSDNLLIFFTGWGCDEYEFEHLESDSDVLLLYEYFDLSFNFDFSKYKNINLAAFSAGVFIASIMSFNFRINKKIAISGNPYLFDEQLGLSKNIQDILCNITEETADNFAKNYLIKTEDEWNRFHHSKRTLKNCRMEFDSLKNLYKVRKEKIINIYDCALFGEEDKIFNISNQKDFYKTKLKVVKNARHNLFFRINRYEQLIDFA